MKRSQAQTIHGTHRFHRRPWRDSVELAGTNEGTGSSEVWYGQIQLLFWHGEEKLALVRYYQQTDSQDALTRHGCIHLKWAVRHGSRGRVLPDYAVVPLTAMIRRVYVLPDFKLCNLKERPPTQVANLQAPLVRSEPQFSSFHVSAFKWDRCPPDSRSIQQQQEDDDDDANFNPCESASDDDDDDDAGDDYVTAPDANKKQKTQRRR